MPFTSLSVKNLRLNPFSIVPNANPEMFFVVADFNLYALRCRMPEGIAQRLRGQSVHFVPQDWMQSARRTFHYHLKGSGSLPVSPRQFLSNSPNSYGKVVLLHRGHAQALHRIPPLADRLRCLIGYGFQCFAGIDRTLRQLVNSSLKQRQERLKTLQQSIVKLP